MRPKLLSLLALSAIALVGCSAPTPNSTEPEKTPTKVTETTDPSTGETINLDANGYEIEPSETANPGPMQERPPAGPEPEHIFNSSLASTFEGKEDRIDKSIRHKLKESYYVDRGKVYCEKVESGEEVEPMTDTKLDDDYVIEQQIMLSAQIFLCPID